MTKKVYRQISNIYHLYHWHWFFLFTYCLHMLRSVFIQCNVSQTILQEVLNHKMLYLSKSWVNYIVRTIWVKGQDTIWKKKSVWLVCYLDCSGCKEGSGKTGQHGIILCFTSKLPTFFSLMFEKQTMKKALKYDAKLLK